MGMSIVWSAGVPVYEEVRMSCLKLRWIIQRQNRKRLAGTRVGLAKWVVKGFIRVGLGVEMLPALLFQHIPGCGRSFTFCVVLVLLPARLGMPIKSTQL
jgi:hypothetical protein